MESREHLKYLDQTARELKMTVKILLRVTSGNQFGMDEEEIGKIISGREEYKGVHILGLQYYSGTQKRKMSQLEKELKGPGCFS